MTQKGHLMESDVILFEYILNKTKRRWSFGTCNGHKYILHVHFGADSYPAMILS